MKGKFIIYVAIVSLLELVLLQNSFAQKDTSIVNGSGFIVLDTTISINENDLSDLTSEIDTSHYKSPKKATILSTCMPGLGQFYNEKYWKVPLFLGLVGGATYGVYYTFNTYKYYLDSYIELVQQPSPDHEVLGQLKENKDKFRKYRDYSILGWLAIYGLNIVDANIDAHFSNFDISEDLSLNFNPFYLNLNNDNSTFGMNLVLYF